MDTTGETRRRRRRRRAGLTELAVGLALLGSATAPAVAGAAPGTVPLTLDSDTATLTAASGGAFSADVGITNLTDRAVSVHAVAAGCTLKVGGGTSLGVPAAEHSTVTVTIPTACVAKDRATFTLVPVGVRSAARLSVTATTGATTPNWEALLSFPIGLGTALIWVLVIYGLWLRGNWGDDHVRKSPLACLSGLETSWSFRDSWATNVTAAGGLVATVLGSSSFLNDVLGSGGQDAIGIATIAGVISLALIGAAGVLVLTVKNPDEAETSIGGLLAGTSVALGAAGGQVWAVTLALHDVDLGAAGTLKWIAAGLATLLLVGYAFTSVYGLLTLGATSVAVGDPLSPPPAPELVAAAILAAAGDGQVTHQSVTEVLTALRPAQAPASRRTHALRYRSALP